MAVRPVSLPVLHSWSAAEYGADFCTMQAVRGGGGCVGGIRGKEAQQLQARQHSNSLPNLHASTHCGRGDDAVVTPADLPARPRTWKQIRQEDDGQVPCPQIRKQVRKSPHHQINPTRRIACLPAAFCPWRHPLLSCSELIFLAPFWTIGRVDLLLSRVTLRVLSSRAASSRSACCSSPTPSRCRSACPTRPPTTPTPAHPLTLFRHQLPHPACALPARGSQPMQVALSLTGVARRLNPL